MSDHLNIMRQYYPRVVLRDYLDKKAITAAEADEYSVTRKSFEALKQSFDYKAMTFIVLTPAKARRLPLSPAHLQPPYAGHRGEVWERIIGAVKGMFPAVCYEEHLNDETLLGGCKAPVRTRRRAGG